MSSSTMAVHHAGVMPSTLAATDQPVFPRHREVTTGAITTFVAEAGHGAPIVLLHGNPDTHAVWSGVVERLAASYHCFAPDLPGFGNTRAPNDYSYSLE